MGYFDIPMNRVNAYWDNGEFRKVIDYILSLPEDTWDWPLINALIAAYNNIRKYNEAITLSEKYKELLLQENPGGWYYKVAYAYIGKKEYEEALKYINAREKDLSCPKDRLADFAKMRKKCDKAIAKQAKEEKEQKEKEQKEKERKETERKGKKQKEDTANKPVMDETKLQTVMEIIEKAASLMEEKDCDNDEAAGKTLNQLQADLRRITQKRRLDIRNFQRYWSAVSLETVARGALMSPPSKEELTDEQVKEIVLNITNHSEAEIDWWLNYLKLNTGLDNLTDYIFYPDLLGLDPQASTEQIIDKINADRKR